MAAGTTMFGVATQIQERPAVSTEQREAILEQMGRILSSPLFKHSKHYPAFLRFVVERALDGQDARLKERAIGIEVFGRDRDYDTNFDPVVRTSACEVRKRVAQYYLEPGHESEIRIEMHSGSYVPEFRFPEAAVVAEPVAPPAPPVEIPIALAPPQREQRGARWQLIAAFLVTPLLLALGAVTLRSPASTPLDRFWAPVWGTSDTVMICMGEMRTWKPPDVGQAGPTVLDVMHGDRLAFGDAVTLARLTGLLRASHKRYDIRRGEDFTLTEFRKGPVVLIGAFNNEWTMRLEDSLRFVFEKNHETKVNYIRDKQQPASPRWSADPSKPYAQFTEDYAIISRFVNPLTERMVVVVAGMTKDGTIAAGEFVTEPQYMDALEKRAPKGWDKKNLQVVIRTEVVRGAPGPPMIMAMHVW
jgi:hypothetical protein